MNTIVQNRTKDLWNLRPRLAEGLSVGPISDTRYFVDRQETNSRYILLEWQVRLMATLTGQNTVADGVRAVAQFFPNTISITSLRDFFEWLREENLIIGGMENPATDASNLTAYKTVEQSPAINPIAQATLSDEMTQSDLHGVEYEGDRAAPHKIPRVLRPPREKRARRIVWNVAKLAACVAIGLAFYKLSGPAYSLLVNPQEGSHSFVLAPAATEGTSAGSSAPSPSVKVAESTPQPDALPDSLDHLRLQLDVARKRRDWFYENNDEEGYRKEVQKIAAITRKIGEIQAMLRVKDQLGRS